MHSRIKDEALASGFEQVAVRPDLGPASEISELHENDETRMTKDEGMLK
jgi:hypothetical protein